MKLSLNEFSRQCFIFDSSELINCLMMTIKHYEFDEYKTLKVVLIVTYQNWAAEPI